MSGKVRLVKLPDVFLEIKVAAESLVTILACERFLLVVSMHVKCQIVHL